MFIYIKYLDITIIFIYKMTIKTCKRKKLKNNKYYTCNSKCNLQTKIK